jgi:hypothetical protein
MPGRRLNAPIDPFANPMVPPSPVSRSGRRSPDLYLGAYANVAILHADGEFLVTCPIL